MTPRRAAPPLFGAGRAFLVRKLCCLAASIAVSGCNLAPPYEKPPVEPGPAFKEAVPGGEAADQGWKLAQPRDAALRSAWWEVFDDPRLDDLETRVAVSNQSIIAAEASYRAAYALMQEAQAQLFPTLSLSPSAARQKSSAALGAYGGAIGGAGAAGATTGAAATSGAAAGAGAGAATGTGTDAATATGTSALTAHTINIFDFPLEASYQVDLWGSIRNTVAEDRFAAQASAAQLANALLSMQSTLAQDYFQLRVADEQRRILETTVADYRASLALVRSLVASGVDSEADVATAETQLEAAMAQATDMGVARAEYEHAIAVLIGVSPAGFSIPYQHFTRALPVIPVGVPSDLLERRPDIASAERQVAESNAQIGVARAAFFPSLTLSAAGGFESTAIGSLFTVPNRIWSLGVTAAQTVFDGGARRAASAQAHALNDSQVATYRQTVLNAFESVEDNLAALRILAAELGQAHKATLSAKRAVELTVVLYRNGVDSYVNVITAQNAFLSARETELQVQLRQLVASVMLINDLGGGWSTSDLGRTQRMAQESGARHAPAPAAGANGSPGLMAAPVVNETPRPDGVAVPNPPPMPAGEIQPDELIKQNEAAVGP